jgi:sulfide:quinone oxidoreductase
MAPKALVLGGNFAGVTAALSLKRELGADVDVMVSKSSRFTFNPSFIWIPFGKRTARDVSVPIAPPFERHGVKFVHGEATKIDPGALKVDTTRGVFDYDYLVIATGYLNDLDVIPGLGRGGNAYTITTLEGAVDAAEGWARFINEPGPIIVGATQGAACFGAAYEFVFNVAYQLKRHGLAKRVPVHYVSAEPFPGHFGIGGLAGGEKMLDMFFRMTGIQAVFDVAMEEVAPGQLLLQDGRRFPFRYAMIVPPFVGADVPQEKHSQAPGRRARPRQVAWSEVPRMQALSALHAGVPSASNGRGGDRDGEMGSFPPVPGMWVRLRERRGRAFVQLGRVPLPARGAERLLRSVPLQLLHHGGEPFLR